MIVGFLIRGDLFSPLPRSKMDVLGDGVAGAGQGAAVGSSFGPYGAVIGGALGAIGNIASGVVGSNQSMKNQMSMLRYMNDYNSPVKQVERLRAAGLNPYLMSGAINTGNQAQPGDGAAAADNLTSGLMAGASGISSLALQAAEIRKTNAEASGVEKDNSVKDTQNQLVLDQMRTQIQGLNLENNIKSYDLENLKPKELVEMQSRIENLAMDTAKKMSEIGVNSINQKVMVAQLEQIGLSNSQARLVLQYYEPLVRLQLAEGRMRVQTGYQNANSQSAQANAAMTNAMANKLVAPYSAALMNSQAKTENALRPFRKREQSWSAENSKWNAKQGKLAFDVNSAANPYEEWKADVKSAPVAKHVLGILESIADAVSPVLNGVNQASNAYRNFSPQETTIVNNSSTFGPKGKTYNTSTSVKTKSRPRRHKLK